MRRAALTTLYCAIVIAVAVIGGCGGCALFVPEGEATFWSGPSALSILTD